MSHAITIGDLVGFITIIGGLLAIPTILFFVLWLFNPWRSGH